MHRIDADSHVGNQFNPGDPLVPRAATQVDHHWLNAVQEELANAITSAGVALVKGTNTQLKKILGLSGSGDPAPGDRYFSGMIDVFRTASATGLRALRVTVGGGDESDIGGLFQATDATALKATTSDGVAVHAVSTGSGPAIKAEGYVDLTGATVSAVHLLNEAAIPGTVGPAGTLVYVAGGLNKAYISDGTAWNALW